MSDSNFVPNPLDYHGRLDTSAGATGAQLGQISPLFDTPEANQPAPLDAAVSAEMGNDPTPNEDGSTSPAENADDNAGPDREGDPEKTAAAAEAAGAAAGYDPGSTAVDGEVSNSKAPENQIMMGGSPVEPVEGAGPSGAPLTEVPNDDAVPVEAQGDAGKKSEAEEPETYEGEKRDGSGNWDAEALKDELRKRELTIGGNKPDLIKRLKDDDAAKAADKA